MVEFTSKVWKVNETTVVTIPVELIQSKQVSEKKFYKFVMEEIA